MVILTATLSMAFVFKAGIRLDTNAVDLWTQVQEVQCLARRLSRRSARSERRWVSLGEERSA